jgi:hypothetical protein
MPPVIQCNTKVSTTACHEKKNGAAKQPICTAASHNTFGQLISRSGSFESFRWGFFEARRRDFRGARNGFVFNSRFVRVVGDSSVPIVPMSKMWLSGRSEIVRLTT